MFTGLITDIGSIVEARQEGELTLVIRCAYDMQNLALGESIAVNGCCLTIVEIRPAESWFAVQLSRETLSHTAPRWKTGERVNLERALAIGDRLGGHFVTGHVDGLARIADITPSGDSRVIALETPAALQQFIAAKGSVTLDGVSLTVNEVADARFTVNIIPHTLAATTLGEWQKGDAVNLEVDLIARYLARLTET